MRVMTGPPSGPGPRQLRLVTLAGGVQLGTGGRRHGRSQGMVGFSQGSTAASVAPVGAGASGLQFPTPGDQ